MKKLTAILLSLVLLCTLVCFASCGDKEETPAETKPFEVGTDTTEYVVEGSASYAGTVTANVKIVAGEDVIYCGTVKLTSDNLFASEFFKAALLEKDVAQDGLENGFVNYIGSYTNDFTSTPNLCWLWQYNGHNPTNFACNDVHVFDGDYLLYTFGEVVW